MSGCGSVTAWTRWGRSGLQAAATRWTVTTAPVQTDGCCAPIRAAKLPVCGAPGPVGQPVVFPVGGARGPDTGEDLLTVR